MRPNTHENTDGTVETRPDERGAGMVEYALLIALIAVVVITALSAFGGNVGDLYSDANDAMTSHIQG